VTVSFSGPLFDGGLDARMDRAIADAVNEAGRAAVENVREADRAGFRSSSGYTSSRVGFRRVGATGFRVNGGGLAWRPWLEGTAPRNRISTYKGVRPFQRARQPTEADSVRIVTDAVVGVLR
jgi:hypothetical protein